MKSAAANALADAIVEAAARAAKDVPPPPPSDVPSEVDENALASLCATAEKAMRVAEISGDFGAMGSMGRLLVAIQEHRRKIAPPPVEDINDAPDIKAAAERGKALQLETLANIIANRKLLA